MKTQNKKFASSKSNSKSVPVKASNGSSSNGSGSTRNYVGGGWNKAKDEGIFIILQLNKEKLMDIEENDYGDIKIVVAGRREPNEKSGQDVSVYESEPQK